jgi:hypothetical protein
LGSSYPARVAILANEHLVDVDVPPGFDPTLILWLNLAGTLVFESTGSAPRPHVVCPTAATARAILDELGSERENVA